MMGGRDWSELPGELLQHILLRLTTEQKDFSDHIRFAGVCKSWQSVALEYKPTYQYLPWLLFMAEKKNNKLGEQYPPWLLSMAEKTNNKLGEHGYCLFNVCKDIIHWLTDEPSFPENVFEYCCRSSDEGQLIMLEGDDVSHLSLMNPITKHQVHCSLPRFTPFYSKIVLSSHLTSTDPGIVMALCQQNGKLRFAIPGDFTWTSIEVRKKYHKKLGYHSDITYWNGRFYVVNDIGNVAVCDFGGPSPSMKIMDSQPQQHWICNHYSTYNLVESSGKLLLIRWFPQMYDVEVFELDDIKQEWLKVESLGNHTLFLSYQSSFSLRSSDYPGLLANSIYRIDIRHNKYSGIVNLENHSFKPFDICNNDIRSLGSGTLGLWFIPSLRRIASKGKAMKTTMAEDVVGEPQIDADGFRNC